MKLTQYLVLTVLLLSVSAVEAQQPPATKALVEQKQCQMPSLPKKARMPRASNIPRIQPVIPPVTVLHNPEYLSGEASVTVAANSNPLIRIGMAQNGVTLIEFPSADKFFAVHAGNSDLCHPAPVRLNTLAIGSEISWAGVPTQIPPPSTEKVLRPLQEFFPHLRS